MYDADMDQWSGLSLSTARSSLVAASVGTHVLFAGGRLGSSNNAPRSDTVDILDVSTGEASVANLSEAREVEAVATVDTQVVFAGGDRRECRSGTHCDR